jgi:cell division protein FtsZ
MVVSRPEPASLPEVTLSDDESEPTKTDEPAATQPAPRVPTTSLEPAFADDDIDIPEFLK